MSNLSDLNNLEIVNRIENKQLNPRELLPAKRREIVAILGQSYSQAEMAGMLQVSDKTIQRDVKAIRDGAAKLVKDITVEKVGDEIIISWGKPIEELSEQELDTMMKGYIRIYLQDANKEELNAILEGCKGSGEGEEVLER